MSTSKMSPRGSIISWEKFRGEKERVFAFSNLSVPMNLTQLETVPYPQSICKCV